MTAAARGTTIYVVLADDHAQSQVTRGENSGHTLRHVAVVSTLLLAGNTDAQGAFAKDLTLPLKPGNNGAWRVVVFLQDSGSKHVLGAAETHLSEEYPDGGSIIRFVDKTSSGTVGWPRNGASCTGCWRRSRSCNVFRGHELGGVNGERGAAENREGLAASFTIMFVEMLRVSPGSPQQRLLRFLVRQTKKDFAANPAKWSEWMWSIPYNPYAHYAEFKGILYSILDPRTKNFFPPHVAARIRLDQVEWGGVRRTASRRWCGPRHCQAKDAGYLDASDRVFGIEVNGEARAYPQRILAWHEMALDRLGGLDLTVVYCTLCGTVIPYRSRGYEFGTSGLLYESSKLMFDAKTSSLWSTLQGEPVIGQLAKSGVTLEFQPVVTTTWGEWRADHPQTTALSLQTGYNRNYGEEVAYHDYFATEELMFQVSRTDSRLAIKMRCSPSGFRARSRSPSPRSIWKKIRSSPTPTKAYLWKS